MLDIGTCVWTDSTGKSTQLVLLSDSHLLNIQRFLKKRLSNRDARLLEMSNLVERYYAEYSDKDWFSGMPDVEEDVELETGELRVELMLVSAEVRRRGLVALVVVSEAK